MAGQKAQQVHKWKTKIKHWQELLKQSNTTPPAQQFIFLKWNKTLYKAICPQEGPKAQVFILKNEPVLEINKCKKKALHTIFFKENLHLHNSKPLVSAKQMNFRLRPRSLFVFFFCLVVVFFRMSYKNRWMIMSNGNADSSKTTAFGALGFFSFPLRSQ